MCVLYVWYTVVVMYSLNSYSIIMKMWNIIVNWSLENTKDDITMVNDWILLYT